MPSQFLLALSLLASLLLSGCSLITGIFKAGEWVGALVVAVIVIGVIASSRWRAAEGKMRSHR